MIRAPSSAAADRNAILRAGFPAFVELWGRHKFGARFVYAWHLIELAKHMEALYWGDIYVFLASLCPGAMKSFVVSRCYPAWVWSMDPSHSFMRASYGESVANTFASDTREMCESDWYLDRWGRVILGNHPLRPHGVNEYWTVDGGFSLCSSIAGGRLVGRHAQTILIDDPFKAQTAIQDDPTILEKGRTWFNAVATTRGAIGDVQRIACAAQRFHEYDMNGLLIEQYGGLESFAHLMLPWHFEPERACKTKIGGDRRTKAREELFDNPNTRHTVESELRFHGQMSPIVRSQYQQDPQSGSTKYFPANTLLDFEGAPDIAQTWSVISIDPTFTGGLRSDLMAIDVWGYINGHFYCYYSEQVRRDFDGEDGALAAIRRVRSLFNVQFVLIEAAANGEAIYSTLKNEIVGLERITPKGSKLQRAFAASKFFHCGRVHFDKRGPWYAEKERYLTRFPSPGVADDPVDTVSQAINWFDERYGASTLLMQAMAQLDATTPAEQERLAKEAGRPLTMAAQLAGFAEQAREPGTIALPFEATINYEALSIGSLEIAEFE